MAKKQTRRSVSIRGATYEKVRSHCEKNGLSMSEFVEELIAGYFGNGARPTASRAATPPPRLARRVSKKAAEEKLSFDELQDAARFFTF